MPAFNDVLREIILQNKLLSEQDIDHWLSVARDQRIPVLDLLINNQVVDGDKLGSLIAAQYQLQFVKVGELSLADELITVVPDRLLRQNLLVPFERTNEHLKVAISDPTRLSVINHLAKKTGVQVLAHYAHAFDIKKSLRNYRADYQKLFRKIIRGGQVQVAAVGGIDPPIAKVIDTLIEVALEERASDIHIEPQDDGLYIRFRVDGMLRTILTLDKNLTDRLVTRIKVMADLRTDEHLSAQDGKIKFATNSEDKIDLRVSIIPIADGEKVVMRILNSSNQSYDLTDLGFSKRELEIVTKEAKKSFGMIISTGPTGSGKTTTIYSILKTVDTATTNLTSIEDPIEYRIKGASQVQVNTKTNLTFARGLRSLLRQDPDYIFVGEVRDNETAGIAVDAALTGHLVFSTLHTNSAAGALPRLIDMEVEPFLVSSTVSLIIGQRLVRKICDECRVQELVTKESLISMFTTNGLEKVIEKVATPQGIPTYKGGGCQACHGTGYRGRVGIYEVLEVTNEIRELINQRADSDKIEDQAVKDGMLTMQQSGVIKILEGLTTVEEVLRMSRSDI